MSATILLILRLALTASLYIFLGVALWIIWQDLRQHSKTPASRLAPPLTLRGVQPDGQAAPSLEAETLTAQVFRFTSSEIFIGRDPASECRLDDKTISARHARLAYHHGQWWVEDLKSRNGTSLNGVSISTPVVLTSGDRLQCGACAFSVTLGEEGPPEGSVSELSSRS